jgi:hypothetical protein
MRTIGKCLLSLTLLAAAGCAPRVVTTAPHALVVEEYLLSGPPDISTEQLVIHFVDSNQEQILARTSSYRDFALRSPLITIEFYPPSDTGWKTTN